MQQPPTFATPPSLAPSAEPGYSIETGYFVFTLMPSLHCRLRCPHCYLSLAQRRDRSIMSVADLAAACSKVDAYWDAKGLASRTVVAYWYGGEPTSMGTATFEAMVGAVNDAFPASKGYAVRHVVLSAMVSVRDEWFDVFHRLCGSSVQSSYDGTMRGGSYLEKWDRRMRDARSNGLATSTISVVNRAMLDAGPVQVMDYLEDLGVSEASFLPFMLNEQNEATGKYEEFAPRMDEWSEFMIAVGRRWIERRAAGGSPPAVGQAAFVLAQSRRPASANVAAQTLFLLPDGTFVLPDYRDGWNEYMRPFGNILSQDFADVLSSKARRDYLRRQFTRNGNADCGGCDLAGCCVMEFWKPNRDGDDCFGGRRFVEWVLAEREALGGDAWDSARLF